MLGGMPQVAQLYSQMPDMNYFDAANDEAAFVKSRPPLPSDLAQSYRPLNPWPVSATCGKDFVLVCEFSELEGPKPLITIPKDGGSTFDKNMYAVKIMAVDYNATNYARTTNTFKLSEDTAVMMEDKKEGTYSYIHHFTLYDIHARGFVRPFCMAYITADKNKLRSNLERIMACFHQVSQYYRYGNYVIFREEMVRRLADLIFTKENIKTQLEETEVKQEARAQRARRPILSNNHNPQPTSINKEDEDCSGGEENGEGQSESCRVMAETTRIGEELEQVQELEQEQEQEPKEDEEEIIAEIKEYARKREELESVEKAIREIEVILEAVNPALKKNKKMEARFRRLKERYCESPVSKSKPQTPQNVHQDGYCSDEDTPRLPQKTRLRKRSSSHSEMVEETDSNNDPNAPYQPQIVRAANPRRFDRSLRTLHELCSWGAKEGLNRLRKLLKLYCRDANVLHLEKQESSLVEPSVSLLTIGRTVTVNFLNAINLQCISTCHLDHTGMLRRTRTMSESISLDSFSSCQEDSSAFESPPPSYEARFVMGSSYASLESLYYEVDESMEDLLSNSDPKTMQLDENGLYIEESFGSWIDISRPLQSDQLESSSASSDTRLHPSSPQQPPSKLSSGEEEDGISIETASSKAESSTKMSNKEEEVSSSVESLVKYTSVPSGEEPVLHRSSRVPVGCYASRLCNGSSELPGSGIKDFIGRYVFAIHLIYALLSGRPVVVAASPSKEREVNLLIRTMWLFVPGHSSRYHLVIPWHVKPLNMTDLARMKLVGLSKPKSLGRVVPASMRRYVTLFDYDQSTLYTPAYKGSFLDAIVSRNKQFQTDQSYLAYIQSVLLELGTKAFLYYHSYCLNSPSLHLLNSTFSIDSISRQTGSSARVSSTSFLAKLGLTDSDCSIVEYWVELIKRQQIDEILLQQGSAQFPTPSIRLDHRMCSRYQI